MEEEKKQDCIKNYNSKLNCWNRFLTLILILGVIGLGVVSILKDKLFNDNNLVSISAEGRVFAKPDIATIKLGIKTEVKKEAQLAVKEGADKMNNIIEQMKKMEIEEKDIKTTAYSVNPSYVYPRDGGRATIAGYELYQEITIKIRNLDKIGDVIKESANIGANQIGNVAFTIDDQEGLKALARAEAIKNAKEKARQMEKESGIKLGKIIGVYENDYYQACETVNLAMGVAGLNKAESSPIINSGESEVSSNITLTYKVK
ncbi:MAG TPA: SIMPL domain-containing protein [bacterium]|jgi:hypothetical protein|nr:SIMPL domain-containing protein [bacterium]HOG38454.1 SIMPL domain-containing protein [bacterium]